MTTGLSAFYLDDQQANSVDCGESIGDQADCSELSEGTVSESNQSDLLSHAQPSIEEHFTELKSSLYPTNEMYGNDKEAQATKCDTTDLPVFTVCA